MTRTRTCEICKAVIPEWRGGRYCPRCAGMHGKMSWAAIQKITDHKAVVMREQRIFD